MMTMPPPPPAPKKRLTGLQVVLLAAGGLLLLGWIGSAISGDDTTDYSPPSYSVPDGPSTSAVDIAVKSCSVEYGYGKAKVEVTVSEPLSYVGLGGDFKSADGIVIGQGLGNLSDPVPGQTYIVEVLYDLNMSGRGGTCTVRVDTVYD